VIAIVINRSGGGFEPTVPMEVSLMVAAVDGGSHNCVFITASHNNDRHPCPHRPHPSPPSPLARQRHQKTKTKIKTKTKLKIYNSGGKITTSAPADSRGSSGGCKGVAVAAAGPLRV
jgi:hypothetical protein